MTDLAKLVVRLEAETSRYASELDKAKRQLAGFTEEEKKAAAAEEQRQRAMAEGVRIFESMRTPMERYNADIEKLNSLLSQGAVDQVTFNRAVASAKSDLDKTNSSLAEGRKVFDQTRTPMERYNAELNKLRTLVQAGAIDQETFRRAVSMAEKEVRSSEAALRRSSSAYQVFNKIAQVAVIAVTAAAATLTALVKSAINAADRMSKLAESTGIATEVISEMGYAASLSDIGTEELAKSLQRLATTAIDATRAGSNQAKTFADLGVKVTDASGRMRETDEILLDVAERFSKMEDGARKASFAQDLFSKSGQKMIPFLNQGRAGIEALREEARRLGLTLTEVAAKQAEEFNDNMTRLKAAVTGIALQLAMKLLPQLIELSEKILAVVTDGDKLETVVEQLVIGFKTFATIGLTFNTILQAIGKSIATVIAALGEFELGAMDFSSPIAFMQGLARNITNADDALRVLKIGFSDVGSSVATNLDRMIKLWQEQEKQINKTADTARDRKEDLALGDDSPVQEVKVTAKKIERSEMDKLLDDFNEQTKTSSEMAQALYNKEKQMLEVLLKAKIINIEEYNDRLGAAFDKFLPAFEVTVDKMKDKTKEATNELNEFQKEAFRNTQDIIAEGLETALDDGFSKGADGALKAFGDMLEKMVLQAIAADIASYLFGDPEKKGSDGGGGAGLIGTLFSSFGGTKDRGGRGKKGTAYAIGTGAQPEMFVPDTSGSFLPRDQWMSMLGGAQGVTQNIYVQGRADLRTARQMEIEAQRRQRSASARLG